MHADDMLPEKITSYLQERFSDPVVLSTRPVIANDGDLHYEIEVMEGDATYLIKFDPFGRMIGREMVLMNESWYEEYGTVD